MYPTKNYVTCGNVIRNYVAALVCVFCCQVSFSQTNYLKLPAGTPQTYNGQSNFVIENLSFTNMDGNNITIFNGNNITIRNCYFGVSQGIGVELENCSNVTIENCFFANNKSGVYATSCSGIKVNNNQFINAQGPFPRGQFVQFNSVTGSGNSVSGNRGECFRGESYAEDLVNMYRSNGTSGSPVLVKDNLFRGGGPSPSGGGLMSGDFDGGYVIVENNKLVFPGNYGIGIAGGNNIKLLNNCVYSERKPWTNVGIYVWAQQGASCSQITVEGNKSTWTHKDGFNNPFWDGGNCGPITWDGLNSSGQSLASMGFPDQLITCVTEDELWQVREQSREFVVNVQVNEMPPWLPRPTADAGEDKTVTTTTTTLSGSGGNTYRWVQVSGPNNASLTNANSNNVSLSGLVNGIYTFRLEAYDAEGASDADWVVLTVSSQPVTNQAPAANAGNDITITLPTSTATLNGTGSADADGTITSYQWTQVSGPNTATIGNATQASASLSGLIAGTYNFRLTVRDNDGATDTDEVTVIVNSAPVVNQAPVSNAGNNITITLPTSTATLNGTGSADADGTITSYQWTQVSGPNTATIGNATQASASLSGLIGGTYNFRLTVRDNDGATDTDEVTVIVNPAPVVNQAPVSNAGNNITITLPTSTATLNGTGSSDADGTITSYQWTQVSGPNTATIGNATQASASLSGLIAGTYNFRLTVRDNDGATDTDEVTVIVNPAPVVNQAPVSNAGNNITITLPTSTATLNGTGSSDADGTITSYQWTQVSGPNTAGITANNQATTSVTGLIEGVYNFQLSIRDNDGGVSSDLVTITVNPAPNRAPVANAGTNIRITLPVNTASLNGSGSSDPDGTIASYQWTQLSGPTTVTIANSTRPMASVSGLVGGIYNFRLTIRDNDGASATANVSVTVSSAANQLPIADAGSNITITLPVNTASLNGTGSSDPDGSIASYQWSQVSGPNTATMINDDQAISALSNLTQGTYSFRLTIKDNKGATGTETVNVIVNAAPNRSPVANAGNSVSITLPVNSVSANGNRSTDPDGTIVSYQWSQVSGPNTAVIANGNKATATFSGLVKGSYSFRLIVKDDKGASSSATLSVTVNAAANLAPIANAGTSMVITLSSNEATLNGSLSKDPDGSIKSYQWQQLSGPVNAIISSSVSSITTVTGFKEGDYVFQLTVKDNLNATAKDTVQIAVVNNFRSFASGLMLYPNPATDKINFNYYSEEYNKAQINIYDVTGRKVMASIEVASSLNLFKIEINIGHLKPGVYLFEAIMNNKEKIGAKFLKQQV